MVIYLSYSLLNQTVAQELGSISIDVWYVFVRTDHCSWTDQQKRIVKQLQIRSVKVENVHKNSIQPTQKAILVVSNMEQLMELESLKRDIDCLYRCDVDQPDIFKVNSIQQAIHLYAMSAQQLMIKIKFDRQYRRQCQILSRVQSQSKFKSLFESYETRYNKKCTTSRITQLDQFKCLVSYARANQRKIYTKTFNALVLNKLQNKIEAQSADIANIWQERGRYRSKLLRKAFTALIAR